MALKLDVTTAPHRPRRVKKCRDCQTTDRAKFGRKDYTQCNRCRGIERGKERAALLGRNSKLRAAAEAVNRGGLCLEGDMRVSSFDSFARTCKARRESHSAMMLQAAECRFCSAHKLVAAGKLPGNIKLL